LIRANRPLLYTMGARCLLVLCAAFAFFSLPVAPAFAVDCPECVPIQQELESARRSLQQHEKEQAIFEADYDANLKEQLESIEAEDEATRNFNRQIGTGGSSTDPSTGSTIEARAGADGVVTITTTHPDGRSVTATRDSKYMKKLREEISRQRKRRKALEKDAVGLKGALEDLEASIWREKSKIRSLEQALNQCLTLCRRHAAVTIDPASHIAVHVVAGSDPQAVINDYGLEGADVLPVPPSAGGGHLISAPKPGKDVVEQMENDPRCKEVDEDFCREFLPGSELIPHDKQPLMLAQADTGSVMQGVTSAGSGAPRGGTSVTLRPEDPPVDGADPGWSRADGQTPAFGVTGADGKYSLSVDDDTIVSPNIVIAASGWTTVTQSGSPPPTDTPAAPEGGTSEPTEEGEYTVDIQEIYVTGGKIGIGVDYGDLGGYGGYGGTTTFGGGGTVIGPDDGDDPRDTPAPPVYGEEVDEPERIGILLRLEDWEWIPAMNDVTWVAAKLYEPDPTRPGIWKPTDAAQRVMTVRFARRSNEPGQTMNYDLHFAPEDSPDLYLPQEAGLTCSGDPVGKGFFNECTTQSPHNEEDFAVRSIDFGGYSRMEVSCEGCVPLRAVYPYSFIGGYKPSDAWPDAIEAPVREHRLVRVPHDENNNNIADQHEIERHYAGIKADDDSETRPWGDGTMGDGYSAYQEYRGFMVGDSINHRRSDWFKKTLLVDNQTSFSLGKFRTASGLEVLEIPLGAHKKRQANYNNKFAHVTDQHCLVLLYEDLDGPPGKVSGFGPPKNVDKVMIDWSYGSGDTNDTVAHELGHAVGMQHHGNKLREDVEVHPHSNILSGVAHAYTHPGVTLCGKFLPATLELGQKGDQASGVENCIMRYRSSADIYQQSDGSFHCHRKGRPRLFFCESTSGTGQNSGGRMAGHASNGNCLGQMIVNDK